MIQMGLQFDPPKTSDNDVRELLAYLKSAALDAGLTDQKGRPLPPGWATAFHVGVALGWNERKVRKVASDCDQVISFPGSPGYKHVDRCSREEYLAYRASMRRQAREMIGRVLRTDRQFFGHPAAVV